MADIEAFISSTRGPDATQRVPTRLSSQYQSIFTDLLKLCQLEGVPLNAELTVVDSFNAGAETLPRSGAPHIIYDRYTGQSFNALNRILLADTDEVESLNMYLSKVYASLLTAGGRARLALDFALLYRRRADGGVALPETPGNFRGALTLSCELFVMAHELAHGMLASSTAVQDAFSRSYVERLEKGVAYFEAEDGDSRASRHSQMRASLERDYREAYLRVFGYQPTPEELEHYMASVQTETGDHSRRRHDDFEAVTRNAALREECVCDSLAAHLTGRYLVRHGRDYEVGVVGSWIAMHYMRMMRTISVISDAGRGIERLRARASAVAATDLPRFRVFRMASMIQMLRFEMGVNCYALPDSINGLDIWPDPDTDRLADYVRRLGRWNQRLYSKILDHQAQFYEPIAFSELQFLMGLEAYERLDDIPVLRLAEVARRAADPMIDSDDLELDRTLLDARVRLSDFLNTGQ